MLWASYARRVLATDECSQVHSTIVFWHRCAKFRLVFKVDCSSVRHCSLYDIRRGCTSPVWRVHKKHDSNVPDPSSDLTQEKSNRRISFCALHELGGFPGINLNQVVDTFDDSTNPYVDSSWQTGVTTRIWFEFLQTQPAIQLSRECLDLFPIVI